jgi:hypothetical protein
MRHATDDNTIRRMRCACWVNKATGTPSEYVIFTAFLPQQWQSGHASIKRYSYISRLVVSLGRNHICQFKIYPFTPNPSHSATHSLPVRFGVKNFSISTLAGGPENVFSPGLLTRSRRPRSSHARLERASQRC